MNGSKNSGSRAGTRSPNIRRPITARELAMDILVRVEQEQAYSNLLLNQALQKANLPRSEAGLATELVYGTIQRLNTIDYYLGLFLTKGLSKRVENQLD